MNHTRVTLSVDHHAQGNSMTVRPRNQVVNTMAEPRYRGQHLRIRATLAPAVEAGQAECAELICLMPTRAIQPGEPWDLAHDREGGGWLGPAHARCNRSEGWHYRQATARKASVWMF